jgi:hypothetical protein
MADISYSRTFQHVDWIDNEDVVQAGGEKGFNQKFHDLEAELDKLSAVVGAIKAALSNIQELADNAVTTKKIAPNAVTTEKLAPNSVGINQIQNGAIDGSKLAPNSISWANIAPGGVTRDKIAFFQVNSGNAVVPPLQSPNNTFITAVQKDVENADRILYLPMMTIASTSGGAASDVEPAIVYQGRANSNLVDVMIRFTNRGNAQATVAWAVDSINTAFIG